MLLAELRGVDEAEEIREILQRAESPELRAAAWLANSYAFLFKNMGNEDWLREGADLVEVLK